MNRLKKLILNSLTGVSNQIVTIICGLILPRLILSTYGSSANGLVQSIAQFIGFISLCELGVGAVVKSSLYEPLAESNSHEVSCIYKSSKRFFVYVGVALVAYVFVLCALYPRLISEYGHSYVVLMILALSLNSFFSYFFGMNNTLLLQADQRAYIPAIINSVATILNTIFCFVMIKFGATLLAVKFTTAFIFLLRPVCLSFYVNRRYIIDKHVTYEKEPIHQKWNGISQHIASVITDHTDVVVLTCFATLKDVSIYSVYYMIVSNIRSFILSALNGVEATMGNMYSLKEDKRLFQFFNYTEWIVHAVVIVIFTVTGLTILPFVMLYTQGVDDTDYRKPLFSLLITIAMAVYSIQVIYKSMVKAAGHYRQTQKSAIIEALINVGVSVAFVKFLGLVGVAIGTILAMSYRLFYHIWYLHNHILHRPYYLFIKQMIVDLLIIGTVYLMTFKMNLSAVSYAEWILHAMICLIITVLVTITVNFVFYRDNVINIKLNLKQFSKK